MKSSEISFSIHDGNNPYHGEPGWMIVVFCPTKYWNDYKYLPDFYYANKIEKYMPDGYFWDATEEPSWRTKKSREEIQKELTDLGFKENIELEKFLAKIWECL